jgi:endonuclease III
MNRIAIRKLPWMLKRMRSVSKGAAVLRAEEATKHDPFKILVFTMLSARTKDDTTLDVVERLFRIADTPKKIAALNPKKLESILYGVGFYHVKAKHLHSMCVSLMYGMPDTLEGLLALPGVGRKTANIVLARAFNKGTIGVDVHVNRISNRLGIVSTKKPEETEKELMRIVPKRLRRSINRSFVAFGQTVCLPRNPKCPECPLNKICFRIGVI